MSQARPFSKLKKQIESLFVPELKLKVNCISYPMKIQHGNTSVPRFYIQLGKEKQVIWDFPKNFPVDGEYPYWANQIGISKLIREYIDAPIIGLLNKKFEREQVSMIMQYLYSNHQDEVHFDLKLTDLFKAGDRRIGREKLLKWSRKKEVNPKVKLILENRFTKSI